MRKIILLAGCFVLAGCSATSEQPKVNEFRLDLDQFFPEVAALVTTVSDDESTESGMLIHDKSASKVTNAMIDLCIRRADYRDGFRQDKFNSCLTNQLK